MKKNHQTNQESNDEYYGRILNGNYSNQLKSYVADCINRFRAFDEIGNPSIPYISAWKGNQYTIWYEFVGIRFLELLGCDYLNAAEYLRNSVVERHVYSINGFNKGINQQIVKRKEMKKHRTGLRKEAKNTGFVEAVYKISIEDGKTTWLKDQATIKSFKSDKIYVSLGNLTIVNKEMEAEEQLKQTQKALKESENKFREQAIHDNLTGLYNTRYLYKALSELIEKSSLAGKTFSLIFMDIDNFKHVVDTHGHLNASQALQEIAATIKSTLQPPAYGVAYGGDEFIVILPNLNKTQAMDMAETIRSRIKETTYLQNLGLKVHINASLGVSTYPYDAATLPDLLALADQAMFSVKEKGKDSVCGISHKITRNGDKSEDHFSYDC
jgi:diguanylate cyclase (GGDEF)-like protein